MKRNQYCRMSQKKNGKSGGFWKLCTMVSLIIGGLLAAALLEQKEKNKKYLDALIDVSERFPKSDENSEELKDLRKMRWQKARARHNRKTVNERMAKNRSRTRI